MTDLTPHQHAAHSAVVRAHLLLNNDAPLLCTYAQRSGDAALVAYERRAREVRVEEQHESA